MNSAPLSFPEFSWEKGTLPKSQALKEHVEGFRQQLKVYQTQLGLDGKTLCNLWTQEVDDLLGYLSTLIFSEPDVALVSVGGYGRSELCPYSDLDLLFLTPKHSNGKTPKQIEQMLYILWDSGFEVGHSVRNHEESLQIAKSDFQAATSLLDMRFLFGKKGLYDDLREDIFSQIFNQRNLEKFVEAKMQDLHQRHHKYGDSIYLLEPNIKQGVGGLRDINTVEWMIKARHRMEPLKAMRTQALLYPEDTQEWDRAKWNLFRLRFFLHFDTSRSYDVLSFEIQSKCAETLGFQDTSKGMAVEQFMRQYYYNARNVERLSEQIFFEISQKKQPTIARPTKSKSLGRGLVQRKNYILPEKEGLFSEDPTSMMVLFAMYKEKSLSISPSLENLIWASSRLHGEFLTTDSEVIEAFKNLIQSPKGLHRTLETMHRSGFLSQFIPEFDHLYCLVLHDLYHLYTVDAHTLRAIQILEDLALNQNASSPYFERIHAMVSKIQSFDILVLGVLFHDIAKGLGKGHSERGAGMVVEIAKRLQLEAEESALLEFLVRHHLRMAHTSQRRDLKDPQTIEEFCKEVSSVEKLQMLFVLTICDIRAVGPDTWTDWKGNLLEELYLRALDYLRSDSSNTFPEPSPFPKEFLQRNLPQGISIAEAEEIFSWIPENFLQRYDVEDIARYVAFLHQARDPKSQTTNRILAQGKSFPDRGFFELLVGGMDRDGLFSQITGVLSSHRINIMGVTVTTLDNGMVLDIFNIVDLQGECHFSERTIQELEDAMNGVIRGKKSLKTILSKAKRSGVFQKKTLKIHEPTVTLFPNLSDDALVVEIVSKDRIGLLHDLAEVFFQEGYRIENAFISTEVDQVSDTFYIKDQQGTKPTDAESLQKLQKKLLQRLKLS